MKNLLKETVKNSEVDYAEMRIEDTTETTISFQGPILENLGETQNFGGNIRVLVNGGWGFVTFNSPDRLDDKLNIAVSNAKIAGRETSEKLDLAEGVITEDNIIPLFLHNPQDVPLDSKVNLLKGYNEFMLDYHEYIKSSAIRYFDRKTKLFYANSEGTYIEQEKMDMGCNFMAMAVKGTNTQYGFVGRGSSNDYNVITALDDDIKKACDKAISMLDADPITGGEYTVVIDPKLTGTFIHEAFGHLSEGDNVYEDSKLQDIMKLGRKFGQSCLNVYDSGLDAGHRGYLKYDDEGVPAGKTYLIKKGKLVGRLHSRETAGRMNEAVTGNARAISYRFPPICRMRNTCIENGNTPFEDMIKGIKLGVYAKDAFGGQTNGELFTFTAGEAFMIRDGRVEEMVRDVTLSGNVFTTLANIEMVGNDFEIHDSGGGCGKGGQMPLPVSHGGPHIRVKSLVIGGKED